MQLLDIDESVIAELVVSILAARHVAAFARASGRAVAFGFAECARRSVREYPLPSHPVLRWSVRCLWFVCLFVLRSCPRPGVVYSAAICVCRCDC